MPHQPPNPGAALTNSQATRLDGARRDLEYAHSSDVARLDEGGLILLVEKLRRRLDDMVNLVDEIGVPPTQP